VSLSPRVQGPHNPLLFSIPIERWRLWKSFSLIHLGQKSPSRSRTLPSFLVAFVNAARVAARRTPTTGAVCAPAPMRTRRADAIRNTAVAFALHGVPVRGRTQLTGTSTVPRPGSRRAERNRHATRPPLEVGRGGGKRGPGQQAVFAQEKLGRVRRAHLVRSHQWVQRVQREQPSPLFFTHTRLKVGTGAPVVPVEPSRS
jgi:hypothetical protein